MMLLGHFHAGYRRRASDTPTDVKIGDHGGYTKLASPRTRRPPIFTPARRHRKGHED